MGSGLNEKKLANIAQILYNSKSIEPKLPGLAAIPFALEGTTQI